MKRINYFYYICMIALLPLVDKALSVGNRISRWFLLLLPVYITWVICSAGIFYSFNRRKGPGESFIRGVECEGGGVVFWLDKIHGELAALFLLNPFKVQYFSLIRIEDAGATADYISKDGQYAGQICLNFILDGKKMKFSIAARNRYSLLKLDDYGGLVLERVQKFADEMMEAKRTKGRRKDR